MVMRGRCAAGVHDGFHDFCPDCGPRNSELVVVVVAMIVRTRILMMLILMIMRTRILMLLILMMTMVVMIGHELSGLCSWVLVVAMAMVVAMVVMTV